MTDKVATIVVDRLLEVIESSDGVIPWSKPWSGDGRNAPRNLVSNKVYNGFNAMLLSVMQQVGNYSSPYWLTYKQAGELGGNVRKGEKGTPIVYYTKGTSQGDSEGEEKEYFVLRYYNVFNYNQCENLPELPAMLESDQTENSITWASLEAIITTWPHPLQAISYGYGHACYIPDLDRVELPDPSQFTAQAEFYHTALHELIHATGHTNRLNRPVKNHRASYAYAKEEFIAELGASIAAATAGIQVDYGNTAAYLAAWAAKIKENPRAFIASVGAAEKAAAYVLQIEKEETTESE